MIFDPQHLEAFFGAAEKWIAGAGEDEAANIFIACTPPAFKVRNSLYLGATVPSEPQK